jgi:hypothetical protein
MSCMSRSAYPFLSIFHLSSSRTKGTVSHEPNAFFTSSVALSPSIFSFRNSTTFCPSLNKVSCLTTSSSVTPRDLASCSFILIVSAESKSFIFVVSFFLTAVM